MNVHDIFIAASNNVESAETETFCLDNAYGRIDAIRIGDNVLVMDEAEDMGGEDGDGFGYSWGSMEDGEFIDESDAQWADTEEEAIAAVTKWIKDHA